MNRTFAYVMLFIVFILLLSIKEPSVVNTVLLTVMVTLLKYLVTFIHELGHYLAGKLVGYPVPVVTIGERKPFWRVSFCGTLFIFGYGFGGLTLMGSSDKVSRLRSSMFALGGVLFQLAAIILVYTTMGIGNEDNYFLPLIFLVLNGWTIAVSLYPSIIARNEAYYFSDGLLLARIMKSREIHHD
ncbi:hypothetical protein BK146_23095 [Paenibacillus sp. FSL R7-0333]|nr:hypothetical protein BK146_23095 [Paenibacillus sp. FSL R7-0333]